jgi:hypothetical protein
MVADTMAAALQAAADARQGRASSATADVRQLMDGLASAAWTARQGW